MFEGGSRCRRPHRAIRFHQSGDSDEAASSRATHDLLRHGTKSSRARRSGASRVGCALRPSAEESRSCPPPRSPRRHRAGAERGPVRRGGEHRPRSAFWSRCGAATVGGRRTARRRRARARRSCPRPGAHEKDPLAVARRGARLAAAKASDRELIIETTARLVSSSAPQAGGARWTTTYGDASTAMLVALRAPGLDEFVDKVIPELQDRGEATAWATGPTLATTWACRNEATTSCAAISPAGARGHGGRGDAARCDERIGLVEGADPGTDLIGEARAPRRWARTAPRGVTPADPAPAGRSGAAASCASQLQRGHRRAARTAQLPDAEHGGTSPSAACPTRAAGPPLQVRAGVEPRAGALGASSPDGVEFRDGGALARRPSIRSPNLRARPPRRIGSGSSSAARSTARRPVGGVVGSRICTATGSARTRRTENDRARKRLPSSIVGRAVRRLLIDGDGVAPPRSQRGDAPLASGSPAPSRWRMPGGSSGESPRRARPP
jgi:hypothetical protein